jgi:N-methylhydantoinase A
VNGYAMPDHPVEIVNLRLAVVAARPLAPHEPAAARRAGPIETRAVWFRATGFADTAVYRRAALGPGDRIDGPAIVEQMDSTTVIPPGWRAVVAAEGSMLMGRDT